MEPRGSEAFPTPEQPETPEAPAAIEIIGLKEALSMISETFGNDEETLDLLQKVIDQPKPDPDDLDAKRAYDEAIEFAEEISGSIVHKTERSRDIAQQIHLRIEELQKPS